MAQQLKTDWILFFTVLLMVAAGILVVYSASSVMAQMDPRFHNSWHYVQRQAMWGVLAIIVTLLLLGLVLVLDPANRRWINAGPIHIQPSELAKPALVVFLAFFVTWRAKAINSARYTLGPAAMAVGLVILAVVVADLGTAIVIGAAAALVFFVAGLERRYCCIVAVLAAIGLVIFVCAKTYRLARVIRFFDPHFQIVQMFY